MQKKIIVYDSSVIQEFAAHLYSKAVSVTITSTFGSALVGVLLGIAFSTFVPKVVQVHHDIPLELSVLAFGLIGAIHGYMSGKEKAHHYMLEAQVALCQVQIEKNTSPSN